jgi:hypothetical protein
LAVALLFHHRNYYEFIQNDPAIWLISFRRAGEDKKTLVFAGSEEAKYRRWSKTTEKHDLVA